MCTLHTLDQGVWAVSTSARSSYHHGDLRNACLHAAWGMLAEGDVASLSLRAVARRAGVSANAPYRHFADKDALLTAVVARGYDELRLALATADEGARPGEHHVDMGIAYVHFALDHPAVFRLMFSNSCRSDPEVQSAALSTAMVLARRVMAVTPATEVDTVLMASWATVHGLATLILDGRVAPRGPAKLDGLVRDVIRATTSFGET
jgi:AcrR family transcriptional regulator